MKSIENTYGHMDNFTTTRIVEAKEEVIYNALTQSIYEWWTEMFEGAAQKAGQTFTIRFGPQVFKTMTIEELIHNKKVVWRVVDAFIGLPELTNKKEWVNTQIVWEISHATDGAALKLTHIGLTPGIECYNVCTSGWQSFISSLEKFVVTGVGTPFKLADER